MKPAFARAVWLIVSVLWLQTGSRIRADEPLLIPHQVPPPATSVLLLPALDATPDAANMLAPRQLVIRHRLEYEFITRQFKVLGETLAAKAAETAPGIALGDLSARTAENLDLLAHRTEAIWVVNLVVEAVKLEASTGGDFSIHTRVHLQIWDARRHGWLVDSSFMGEASGAGSPVFVFKNSLDDATKVSLKNLLNPYPAMVSVLQQDSLHDYLAGQTGPFVGDPQTPFSGLKVAQ